MKKAHTLYTLYADTHMQTFKSGERSYGVLFDFDRKSKRKLIGFATDDVRVARQLARCFDEMADQLVLLPKERGGEE